MIGAKQDLCNNAVSSDYVPVRTNPVEPITTQRENAFNDLVDACMRYIATDATEGHVTYETEVPLQISCNKVRVSFEFEFNKPYGPMSANVIVTGIGSEKYLKEIVILFIAAETDKNKLINIEEDLRGVKNSVAGNRQIRVESALNAKPTKIVESISVWHPSVLHLDGHGSPGEFYMMGDAGEKPESVPPEALSKLFESVKDELGLVVFDFCSSHFHAEDAVKYVKFAIGTQDSVDVRVARTFIKQFYRSYAHNNSLAQSFSQAQSAVVLEYSATDFEVSEQNKLFELFSGKGNDPSRCFLCTEEK